MKKAIITGRRQATPVEVPHPKAKEDWAVVKVHAAPMCTEYKTFLSGDRAEFLGHEAVGEVVEVAQPGKVRVGDRVVVMPLYPCGKCPLCVAGDYIYCRNTYNFDAFVGSPEGKATYAQYLLKPSWLLPAIPDDVSYDRAGLALCALGPTFGAFEAMDLTAYDTLLVTGAGPVGLGVVVNARFRGARVIVAESKPERAERARGLGADLVVDPTDPNALARIRDFTEGKGVDCAVECAGVAAAERFCLDATGVKGRVVFVGECGGDLTIRAAPDFLRKGLSLKGSWHYNLNLFPKIMQVIQRSPLIEQLTSHVLPMSGIQEAFELSATNTSAKMILHPWE